MTNRRPENSGGGAFAILNVSEDEERIYRWLILHSDINAEQAAKDLGLTPAKARRLLEQVETKGLVTRSRERPYRYAAVPPDIAVEALIAQRKEDLQQAQAFARALQQEQQIARQRKGQEQVVELITNPEVERKVFDQIQRRAREEVVNISRPPFVISRLDVPIEEDHKIQRMAQRRGVKYRNIYDSQCLNVPGFVNRIFNDINAGEETRILPSVPFKFFVVDRSVGVMPLVLEHASNHTVLLVRASPLLDALCNLFEILWKHSAPISPPGNGEAPSDGVIPGLSRDTEELVALMAAGLNDKRIADELGISPSTLKRRIAYLMKTYNARTRFQLGRLTGVRALDTDLEG